MNCVWKPNDKNQNPWCPDPVGCCDMVGCWNRDGTNQSYCEDPNFMDGICKWVSAADDPWCPDPVGCCIVPWCGESSMQTEEKCKAAAELDFPCYWDGNNCVELGCDAFDNNPDGCFELDWCSYNYTSGECYDPWAEEEFFDDFEVHCWFADFQPEVCGNITGCVYCTAAKVTDPTSMCYQNPEGWCQGHEDPWENWNGTDYVLTTDGATDPLACEDILLKQVCNFGPLPGCKWNATDANITVGHYCAPGLLTDTEKDQFKPTFNGVEIKFCDDPLIVNNQSFCNELKNTWFMPCKWDSNDNECKFDWESTGFGDSKGGDLDFYDIKDEDTCIMAGGKWIKEQYCEDGVIKYESWCEPGIGKGWEQCDDACWACEWQDDGSPWPSASAAQTACQNSALGFCEFHPDSNAPNGFGWCEPKEEFNQKGGGSCETNCADCNAMNNPQQACQDSPANCEWVDFGDHSWCQDAGTLACAESCDKCFDPDSCKDIGPGCTWDTTFNYCKASSGEGDDVELCFDGIDNDNDGKIDCGDSDCAFDDFCGGNLMGDCHFYNDELSCEAAPSGLPGKNCVWVETDWGENWCAFPGENCWMYDSNQSGCDATPGCAWTNFTSEGLEPFCDINKTKAEPCFGLTNESSCNANPNCQWHPDPWCNSPEGQNDPWCQNNPNAGWCDYILFVECTDLNQSACTANPNCTWNVDPYAIEGGWCEPICFGLNASACEQNPNCELIEAICEPEMFAAHCYQYDGNKTACDEHNTTCRYFEDPYGPDVDGQGGEPAGYCDPIGDFMMFENMDPSPPIHLGTDAVNDATPPEVDIAYFGLKEMGDAIGFGVGVADIQNAAACNGYYVPSKGGLGTGQSTTKFYLYLDTDGSETGGCKAYDQNGNELSGFEFKLTYVSMWDTSATDNVSDVRTFYRCNNGEWSIVAVPSFTDKPKMCDMIGGLMIGVEQEDLEQFSEYDDTGPIRIFVATADANHNSTSPSDSVEPAYWTPGTIDFKFECCDCPGQDLDGDGLTAEEDPDCEDFKKFGYVPKEDCFSDDDDDGDGLTNCADPDCIWEPKCENDPDKYDPSNDKEAPKLIWHKVEVYPDSAFIMYDSSEPANGTVEFYGTDSECQTLNATIRDIGIIDPYIPEYKDWHDGPIDNFQFNEERLGYWLTNGTTYYYRLKLCDVAGNCGVSACLSFTTAKSSSKADCPACYPTFEFEPPAGVNVAFDFGSGWKEQGEDCGGTGGLKLTYNQSKQIDIKLAGQDGWEITLINVTIPSNLPDTAKVFDQDDIKALQEGTYVGMTKEKWEQLKAAGLAPEWIKIKFKSDNCTQLWHCADDLSECQRIDTEDGVELLSSSNGWCEWKVPPVWGFSAYGPSDASSSSNNDNDGSSSSSGTSSSGSISTTSTTSKTTTTTTTTTTKKQTTEQKPTQTKKEKPSLITGAATVIKKPTVQAGSLMALAIVLFAALIYYRRHHYKPPRTPQTYRGYPSYGGRYLRIKRRT